MFSWFCLFSCMVFLGIAQKVYHRAHFGTYSRFFLDNVHCRGTEDSVLQCRANPPGIHNCISSETAGVQCVDM